MQGNQDEKPRCSVIVISYQAEKFIGDCLASICEQSYRNVEIIVADDGSTDRTAQIIKEWTKRDSRIRPTLSPQNEGISKNFNRALDLVSGTYCCIIAGDDLMLPDKIGKQLEFLERNPKYAACFHDVEVFNSDSQKMLYRWRERYRDVRSAKDALFYARWLPICRERRTPSGSWFGRSDYLCIGRNDPTTRWSHEISWIIGAHAADPAARWKVLPEILGKYRIHCSNLSREGGKDRFIEQMEDLWRACHNSMIRYPEHAKGLRKILKYHAFRAYVAGWAPKERQKGLGVLFREEMGAALWLWARSLRLFSQARIRLGAVRRKLMPSRP
jgi:glycosyltransferase involved in cell wall biosynthesis